MNNLALIHRQQFLFEQKLRRINYGPRDYNESIYVLKTTNMPSMKTIYSYGSLSSIDEEREHEYNEIENNNKKEILLGFFPKTKLNYGHKPTNNLNSFNEERLFDESMVNKKYRKYLILCVVSQVFIITLTLLLFLNTTRVYLESFSTLDVAYPKLYSSINVELVKPVFLNVTISNYEMIVNSSLYEGNYCHLSTVTSECNLKLYANTKKIYLKTDSVFVTKNKENRKHNGPKVRRLKQFEDFYQQQVVLQFQPNDIVKILFLLINICLLIIFVNLVIMLCVYS